MEFFPANRTCRKSASACSSITVCCRRKIGACPGTQEPKRKNRFVMETWNLDGAEGVAVFCSSSFYCSHFSNVFWLSTGGGASAALLQKVHFCFAMPSYCRSEFRVWSTWRIVVARNTRGRKMVISVDNLYLSPRKGKLAAQCCAMISCNWDLVRGVSCGSSLLGFMKLLFRTISKILCWRGGLAALLQKVWFLLRYDSDSWTMNGCRMDVDMKSAQTTFW